ncbi:hypothetical protein, partial [Staphylococcus auricularis]|uniref:hypothetical protein n=1 Tax=Staphylococcus auricularis TaxID=29379 RepID=UPI00384E12A7
DNELMDLNDVGKRRDRYTIRVKGLRQQLTKDHFPIPLLHIPKTPRFHNITLSIAHKQQHNQLSTNQQLQNNPQQLQHNYLSELQLQTLTNINKLTPHKNPFKTQHFLKQLKHLSQTQTHYHNIHHQF